MAKERITFDDFYQAQYGERWKTLKAAMLSQEEDKTTIPGLLAPYYMDRASIEIASKLPITPGDTVLDMCAAPGGKTIVLLTRLCGKGKLVSNDRSPDRRERMTQQVPASRA